MSTNLKKNSLLRSSGYVLAARGAVILSRLVTIYILSSHLGPSGFGVYTFLVSLALIATTVGNLGFGYSNVFFLSKSEIALGSVLGSSIRVAAVSGLVMGVLLQVLPSVLMGMFQDVDWVLVVILGGAIPLLIFRRYLTDITNGLEAYGLYLISGSSGWVLNGLIVFSLLHLGLLTVQTAIISYCASELLIIPPVFNLIMKKGANSIDFRSSHFRRQLRYGVPVYFRDSFNQVSLYAIYFLIKHSLDSAELGVYALAAQAAQVLLHIPRAGFTVLFPRFSGYTETARNLFRGMIGKFILSFAAVLMVSYVIYPVIVRKVYTQEMFNSVNPFSILLVGIFFLGLVNIFESYLFGSRRQWISLWSSAVSAVVVVIGGILVIPKGGIVGASILSATAYFLYFFVAVALFKLGPGRNSGEFDKTTSGNVANVAGE